MSADFHITYSETDSKARYAATTPGIQAEAELTISKVSPSLIIADHTGVPDAMRGTGAGKALVERLVADARAKGQKIVPLCPFVKSVFARNPGAYADVMPT